MYRELNMRTILRGQNRFFLREIIGSYYKCPHCGGMSFQSWGDAYQDEWHVECTACKFRWTITDSQYFRIDTRWQNVLQRYREQPEPPKRNAGDLLDMNG